MNVFVTGATGFIGSRVVEQLQVAGHQVVGMTRTEAGAKALKAAGARALLGTLENLDSIRRGAEAADGVIHCAFNHDDFTKLAASCEQDRKVIGAIGDTLAGSDRPLLITSGVGIGSVPGGPAREDVFDSAHRNPRIATEEAGNAALQRGVNVSVVRLPQVHDPVKQGLITFLVAHAKQKGKVAYIGAGKNRWAAAPVSDVARLYVLALERGERGARYNAVAEEGVPMRDIAETIAAGLKLPAESIAPEAAAEHFGWLAMFAGMDLSATSTLTRQKLNWHPTGPSLLSDLKAMNYAAR